MSQSRFIGLAVLLILVWGSAFTMVDVAVKTLSPIWVVATRVALAAILITVYTYANGWRLPPLRDVRWRWYAVLGLTGMVLPFFLIGEGQKTVQSGVSAIIIGAMPIITIILAHFFTDEKMTLMKFTGFLVGFSGIILLFIPKDFSLSLVSDWKAQSLILMAAFFYGLTTILAKRSPETQSAVGASMMLISGAIISSLWALIEGIPTTPPAPIVYPMIIGLAIGSTGIATILYLYMIDVKGPTVMASINYFVPVASVVFGIWLLGEDLTLQKIAAFVIVLSGVIISRIGAKSKAQVKPA